MECDACNELNPASHRFCNGCGASLVRACPACGKANSPGSRYCAGCGQGLATPAGLTGLRGGRVPDGEIKHVTVLLSDLVQSTELVAGLDAEAAMESLQPVLQIMRDAVERFGGAVVSGLGDGVMALFGAPLAQEDHAARASHAALAIRDAAGLRERGLSVRTGLHSGEVVVDGQADGAGHELKAYGLTLHLASRLPAQVGPQEICLTEATRELLPEAYDLRPLGPRALRGVPDPVPLHLLVGPNADASGLGPRHGVAQMVGRDREVAQLLHALEAGAASLVSIVGITGLPGTGKSRLCREFAALCRARGIPVDEIRTQPHGTATPLQPMMEFLRLVWLRLGPGDGPLLSADRVEQALAGIGMTDPPDAAVVCDFLGVPTRLPPPAWLKPAARIARLIEVVRAIARQRGARRSVIILENLHWLDGASEAFVAALAEAARSTCCLLVASSRPGYDRPWMHGPHARQIELGELAPQDTEALIQALVGPDPALADLRRRIALRSGGNPFFAEELVHAMQGQGVITGQRGAFRPSGTPGPGVLPATIQAVISTRIDSLPPQCRRVLQTAAVIGETFRTDILRAVAPVEQASLALSLNTLCEGGLLVREPGAEAVSHRFRHALIQEVAYAAQLRTRRLPLHAAIARAMGGLGEAAYGANASLVSYHYEKANEPRQAAIFAAHAARWVGPRSSAEAMRFWHKVRSLVGQEPRSPETDKLRIEASAQIAWVGWREGLTAEQARPFVRDALQWARETDDSITPLLMQVEGRIAQVNGGSADDYVRRLRQAIQLAEARMDTGRVATLQAALSHACGWAGLFREALDANDAALAGATAVSDFDHRFLGYSVQHWAMALRGRILLRLGHTSEAVTCFDAVIGINEVIDPTVQFIGHLGYVDLAGQIGDAAMAKRHAAQVGVLAARHGSSYLHTYYRAVSAIAQGIAGDLGEAVRGVLESLDRLRQTSTAIELEAELLATLAEYRVRLDDPEAAMLAAQDAIALADQRNARLPACRARILMAQAMLTVQGAGASSDAAAVLDQAEALMRESGAGVCRGLWLQARGELDRCVRDAPAA